MTLKLLSEAITEKEQANIPVHCRAVKKLSDSSANELTKSILAWFKYQKMIGKKCFAERQGVEGRYRPGAQVTDVLGHKKQMKGMYLPASNKGAADIKAMIEGKTIEIEVKHGNDKLRPDQIKYKDKIEAGGGIYLVVKTWEDFIHQISKI